VLAPKTRIPAHTGVTNTRLIVHMALVVPPSCGFRVGAETREWREGRAWGVRRHLRARGMNESDEPRIVLIFESGNSFLAPAERDMVGVLTAGVHEYGEANRPSGREG